ncbi:hypothetical protein OG976_21980 [Mycobacterium sp. NBC_00419]|uniref:hypothetical protein n=1 Tax=Mycobacterium sp. NBC_00419 TaxID=2975989 RepID=UPI002E1E2BE4
MTHDSPSKYPNPDRRQRPRSHLIVDASVDPATRAAIGARLGSFDEPSTGETLVIDRDTFDSSRLLAELGVGAWSELVLRSLARETNLLLPSTRFLVIGTGPLSERLVSALSRIGGYVELTSDDPVALVLAARRSPIRARLYDGAPAVPADVDVAIVAGVDHPPLTPELLQAADHPLVVVDATLPNAGLWSEQPTVATVRNLRQLSGPRPVFVVPAPTADQLDTATAESRADFAVLLASLGAPAAEATLATRLLR